MPAQLGAEVDVHAATVKWNHDNSEVCFHIGTTTIVVNVASLWEEAAGNVPRVFIYDGEREPFRSLTKTEASSEKELDVVCCVFVHVFRDYEHWADKEEKVMFIANGWVDWDSVLFSPLPHNFARAPQEWVDRMTLSGLQTKNVTESDTMDGGLSVMDRETGMLGFIFQIETIRWVSHDEVHVGIWVFSGMARGFGETIILVRDNGEWKVIGSRDAFLL